MALKAFKACPLERIISVNNEGRVECCAFADWREGYRVDLIARHHYRVKTPELTETMIKNTAIKILKGEL